MAVEVVEAVAAVAAAESKEPGNGGVAGGGGGAGGGAGGGSADGGGRESVKPLRKQTPEELLRPRGSRSKRKSAEDQLAMQDFPKVDESMTLELLRYNTTVYPESQHAQLSLKNILEWKR